MRESEINKVLEKAGAKGMVMTLQPLLDMCRALGDPQNKIPAVHVAGTNGKGSVCAMVNSVLQKAGLRVGMFSSPAVFPDEPVITVNSKGIARAEYFDIMGKICEVYNKMDSMGRETPTLFELETLLAFMYFCKKQCDVIIVECGMGGRDDSTNIISSEVKKVCVITSVGLDHTKFLGHTKEDIALNKCGIFTKNSIAVCGETYEDIRNIIGNAAEEKGCDFLPTDTAKMILDTGFVGKAFEYKGKLYRISLTGECQLKNAAAAVETVFALRKMGFDISDKAVKNGLERAAVHGRFEKISDRPIVILDGAHNEDAAKEFSRSLSKYLNDKKTVLVYGVLKDKQHEKVTGLVTENAEKVFTYTVENPRALAADKLAEECEKYAPSVSCKSVGDAVRSALEYVKGKEEEYAVAAVGSFYSLGKIREIFLENL